MKKIAIIVITLFLSKGLLAQGIPPTYESDNPSASGSGFQTNNIFIGGNLNLGFGSGYTNIGANPEIGYSFSQWIDAGVVFNIGYNSVKYYDAGTGIEQYRLNTFNYGGGLFARLYPINNFFVQVQPEYNWSSTTAKYPNNSGPNQKYTASAASLLAGVGYSQRIIGQNAFYLAVLFDVNKDPNSPYRDFDGSYVPIIKAGFNFYLHPNR